MSALFIALLAFVVVALATFVGASLLDQRRAQARLIKDRLATAQKAAEREPDEELALLRDEQLGKIPALDTLLRRSARVSAIQESLLQAGLQICAGHFFLMCLGCGGLGRFSPLLLGKETPPRLGAPVLRGVPSPL